MKLSPLSSAIPPSETLAVLETVKKLVSRGVDVVRFDVGEPDFDTPSFIKEAAKKAMDEGYTHYVQSRGIPELRIAIAEHVESELGLSVDPEREVIVTPGAKFSLLAASMALAGPGDEVIILTPEWPTFKACVLMAGAKPVEVPVSLPYRLREEALKEAITPRTRAIMINTPNNPTGGVMPLEDLKVVADLAVDHDLAVISDEIYKSLVYDGRRHVSIATLPGMRERTVIVDGFSKTYAMTGWRLGWAIGPREVIDAMVRIQQASTTHPTSFVQVAGIAALKGPRSFVEEMVKEYDRRRRAMVRALREIEGVECEEPEGAFFVFPDFSSLGLSSIELSQRLLTEAYVSSVPGEVFGRGGEGRLRLAYTVGVDRILEGVRRIKSFVERVKKS
ncbi:MAG: pyridoxal phosphate-dependent aminotransferase [Candidatus Nezhaarchaeota archaeon]|nr:pyridoxal phosphate-dependent aminotransferase [Candidatus Nezhaarchaeota archaeon]